MYSEEWLGVHWVPVTELESNYTNHYLLLFPSGMLTLDFMWLICDRED